MGTCVCPSCGGSAGILGSAGTISTASIATDTTSSPSITALSARGTPAIPWEGEHPAGSGTPDVPMIARLRRRAGEGREPVSQATSGPSAHNSGMPPMEPLWVPRLERRTAAEGVLAPRGWGGGNAASGGGRGEGAVGCCAGEEGR
eukprot:scaffold2738_cov90-Isochrysis_galbana.AAC.1